MKMKQYMKRLLLVFAIFMFSCVSTKEIFTSIEYSDQDDYGYSKENPILIGMKDTCAYPEN